MSEHNLAIDISIFTRNKGADIPESEDAWLTDEGDSLVTDQSDKIIFMV